MRTKTNRKPRLYWRDWNRARLGAYGNMTDYIVIPTDAPEFLLAVGKTGAEEFEHYFNFYQAASAVLGSSRMRELEEEEGTTCSDLACIQPDDCDLSSNFLVPNIGYEEGKQIAESLLSKVQNREFTIETDNTGWGQFYFIGLAGYTGETLKEALKTAAEHAKDETYLLAAPCFHIEPASENAPYPFIGYLRSSGKAYAFARR